MPEEPKEVRVYLVGEKKGVLITDEQNIILTAGGLRLGDPNKKYEDKFVDDFFQPGRDVQIFPIDPDWTHANAATVVKEAYTLPPETYQKIRETARAENLVYGDQCDQIRDTAEKEIEEINRKAEKQIKAITQPDPLEKRILKALGLE